MKLFKNNNFYVLFILILIIIIIVLLTKKCSIYDNFESNSIAPEKEDSVNLLMFHPGLDICGECSKMSEIIDKLNNKKINGKKINVKKLNCLCDEDTEDDCYNVEDTCSKFNIDTYPKLYLSKYDNTKILFKDIVDKNKIKKWITENI